MTPILASDQSHDHRDPSFHAPRRKHSPLNVSPACFFSSFFFESILAYATGAWRVFTGTQPEIVDQSYPRSVTVLTSVIIEAMKLFRYVIN